MEVSKEMQVSFNIAACGLNVKYPAGRAEKPPWQPDHSSVCEVQKVPRGRMGASCPHFGPVRAASPEVLAQTHPWHSRCHRSNLLPRQGNPSPAVSCLSHDNVKTFLFALFCSLGRASP